MRNLTQEDLTQLGAEMVLIRINNDELIRDNEELKQDASDVLQYVTKQFHLSGDWSLICFFEVSEWIFVRILLTLSIFC